MCEQLDRSSKPWASALRWLAVAALASLFIQAVRAQGPSFNTSIPSQIMDQFRNERIQWTTNVWVYANALFGILAIIEFAWSAAVMLLEKSDLQSWTSALIRKLMWIGAFYALLLNGRIWIPAIIDSAGSAGSTTTTAVASVGSVGSGSSAGGGSVSPPSPPSAGSAANGGGARRQPDPPSNDAGDGGRSVDPPIATSWLRGNTSRGENVSSGSAATPAPPSVSSVLSAIGGEPLAGSGFETQPVPRGFVAPSISANHGAATRSPGLSSPSTLRRGTSDDVVANDVMEGATPTNSTNPGSSGVVSDVASVGSAGPASPQPPITVIGKSALTRAADQVRGFRRRLGSLPSDTAPHATPPQIPIEHEE